MPLNMTQGQIWPLCQNNAALRGQIFQKLPKTLSYTRTPWSPRKFLPWALNSGETIHHYKHASKRVYFYHNTVRNFQDHLCNDIYVWLSLNINFNMCGYSASKVCYRFHSIWIYFLTEASLDLVVWYFHIYSCLNTDGPIVLRSAEWMQLQWLNKDTRTTQTSTSH